MDVSQSATVSDVVFPRFHFDPATVNINNNINTFHQASPPSSWSSNGDSIRLTGDTIRSLGEDGRSIMMTHKFFALLAGFNAHGQLH